MASRRIACSSNNRYGFKSSIVHNLLRREISEGSREGITNPFGVKVPERLSMPMETILPATALQNGHIFLGFTDCGRFLLSYTIREEFETTYSSRNEMAFFYKLHIWVFVPYRPAKRVASTTLFSNTGVGDNNLLIDASQWRGDDSRLVILGRNYSPEVAGVRSLFYVTVTTLPSTSACVDCRPGLDQPVTDRSKCLRHSLTTHLVYERVTPFPKFDFEMQLRLKNSIVLNTGNALHIFAYNVTSPRKRVDSTFISELLNPPKHHESRKSKKRLLRCDFWLKISSNVNCLQKILSNCSAREASRITKTDTEMVYDLEEISEQEAFLACIPFSMKFGESDQVPTKPSRRLSQSSLDSELSTFSAFSSRSTNLSQASTADGVELSEIDFELPKSPPKRFLTAMPPPLQGRRKFFKTGQGPTVSKKKLGASPTPGPSKPYDIFEVGVDEVLQDRSLSSYRKRRNADKQYEFSDPDISSENFIPLKLSRRRGVRKSRFEPSPVFGNGSKSPRSVENPSPTFFDTVDRGFSLPRSPRGGTLTVHSPAMSPNYTELGDILRPLTNYTNLKSPTHPLFSPPLTRDFSDNRSPSPFDATKLYCRSTDEVLLEEIEPICNKKSNFSTKANCIAKILRCYVDKEDDNLSVKTDTDDEYNQTVPFPVALTLDVHGSGYRNLQLILNSKVNSSLTPVVEVLQRTLEIEILCNEVASIICLSIDKNFISCFDYDVAILDVCPERSSITAMVVVLIYASNLQKETTYDPPGYSAPPRQKYEAIFSFTWMPIEESIRIVHIGHIREIDSTTPENWNPTKEILEGHGIRRELASGGTKQRVLTNELAVFEWQSLDELLDASGLIRLTSSGLCSTQNSRSNSLNVFSSLTNVDLDTGDDDEDLSDY